MKKIGILTFHFADNFGAILQAYALYKAINAQKGCSAEIINYIPNGFLYECRWESDYEKECFYEKRKNFESFLIENCHLLNRCNYIDENKYDVYCVGSDQLWNTTDNSRDYFLCDIPDYKQKISFATSIALANNSSFLKKEYFRDYVSRFDHISIREEENIGLIEELTKKKCERICDPTILLTINEYDQIMQPIHIDGKYILFFWLKNDDNLYKGMEYVNRLSREKGIPIIHSIYGNKARYIENNKGCMFYSSPGEYLSYIKNAEYVVTNSYHTSLFALRYKKQLSIFLVDSMRSRFDTLISIYGIKNCIIEDVLYINENQINYDIISKKFNDEKEKGMNYLYRALELSNDY